MRDVGFENRVVASHLVEHVEFLRDGVVPFVPVWKGFRGGESGIDVGADDAFGGVDCWLCELDWRCAVATICEEDAVGGAMGDGVLDLAARDAGCRSFWFVERLWEGGVGDGWVNVGVCRWWYCGCCRGGSGGVGVGGVVLRWVEERDFEEVDVCAFRGFCAPTRE